MVGVHQDAGFGWVIMPVSCKNIVANPGKVYLVPGKKSADQFRRVIFLLRKGRSRDQLLQQPDDLILQFGDIMFIHC
jgi:hypothetical protein